MVGMPTLQSDGHIIVLGRLLHKSFRIFPSILSLSQEMRKEFVFGNICGGGIRSSKSNIQDYLEQSRIIIFLYLQFSVLIALSHGTLISVIIFSILRQKIQNVSCDLLIVCIYPLRLQMQDHGPYLSNLSLYPCHNFLILLQFSLLSLFGILKSLLNLSPLFGQWHTKR